MSENLTNIYVLKDPDTLEIRYVGKADNLKKRFDEHIREYKYKSTYKNNWIKGLLDNNKLPIIEVIEKVPKENWGDYEKKWIIYFKNSGNYLTNLTEGGDGGNFGEEINKLISQKLKGKKRSPETKKLLSEIAKKRKLSEEGRKSLSVKRKGSGNSMYGKKQSKFCIESKYKPVIQINMCDEIIKYWSSIKEVSEYLLINRNTIRMVCNGERKSAGGYKWIWNKK